MSETMVDEFLPTAEVRREMAAAARDDLRRQGYAYKLQARQLQAQHPVDKKEIGQLQRLAANSWAGAREMQRVLDELSEGEGDEAEVDARGVVGGGHVEMQ